MVYHAVVKVMLTAIVTTIDSRMFADARIYMLLGGTTHNHMKNNHRQLITCQIIIVTENHMYK